MRRVPSRSSFSLAIKGIPMLASILATLIAATHILAPHHSTAAPGSPDSAVYVSSAGDDEGDGRSLATAYRTLDRAEAAVLAGEADTVYLDGIFRLDHPFTIKPSPRAQRWLAAPGAHPVLDGHGTVPVGLIVNGRSITIQGLRVTNFKGNGILVADADGVQIINNDIRHISSNAWTQAAVLVMQQADDVTVAGNTIQDTGYVGIGYFASKDGSLRHIRIVGNSLTQTCRLIADCGAIYISGRAPSSRGAVITNNRIDDFGPINKETKAIYLDDGLSGADVSDNHITGLGTYAIHVHGGSNNTIADNIIDLPRGQPVLFHQWIESKDAQPMVNNMLRNNIIISPTARIVVKYGGPETLTLSGNKLND